MSGWNHRTIHGYHEWRISKRRTIRDRDVWADAIVIAISGDSDAPASWEVFRDGSPIRRGHSATVKQAKQDAAKALWSARKR